MRFLFAPELCGTPFPKTLPKNTAQKHCPKTLSKNDAASRPSSEPFGVDRPNGITIERGASYKIFSDSLPAIKGSRTPTDAGLPASPCGEARTLARARSPVGVPLRLLPGRQLVPKAQRQATFPGISPARSVLNGRPNRGAETSRVSTGVTRAGETLSQSSEHLTHRSWCRQSDARRRPSAEGTNPLPASTGPAPANRSSLGRRPCTRSGTDRFLFLVADNVKNLSPRPRLRIDLVTLFAASIAAGTCSWVA